MRSELLAQVAARVPPPTGDDCVLVGIDGVDGAGKTIFADELAEVLRAAGRPIVRISADDFHHVRAVRYRRGRDSAEGYWRDGFDYDRLAADVLDPLGPGGSRRYRPVAHDLASDRVLDPPWQDAPAAAVVLLDGLFLHRDELCRRWRFSLFLDAPFEVTTQRLADRDGIPATGMPRYLGAAERYFAACDPKSRASVVIDNSDPVAPRIVTASS